MRPRFSQQRPSCRGIAAGFRLAAAMLFLVAQLAAVTHLVRHEAQGHHDRCEICYTASQFGAAAVPAPVQAAVLAPVAQRAADVSFHCYSRHAAGYASRAPPARA